jgi:hypothetical protein
MVAGSLIGPVGAACAELGFESFRESRNRSMSSDLEPPVAPEMGDRRAARGEGQVVERRQFADSHSDLSPEARELAAAIDNYKRIHRRRFITHEEMVSVIKGLGYRK